jgi:hypothetical protein
LAPLGESLRALIELLMLLAFCMTSFPAGTRDKNLLLPDWDAAFNISPFSLVLQARNIACCYQECRYVKAFAHLRHG